MPLFPFPSSLLIFFRWWYWKEQYLPFSSYFLLSVVFGILLSVVCRSDTAGAFFRKVRQVPLSWHFFQRSVGWVFLFVWKKKVSDEIRKRGFSESWNQKITFVLIGFFLQGVDLVVDFLESFLDSFQVSIFVLDQLFKPAKLFFVTLKIFCFFFVNFQVLFIYLFIYLFINLLTIPEQFSGLVSLNISFNSIRRLPDSLAALPFLATLIISGNPLNHLPPSLYEKSELDLQWDYCGSGLKEEIGILQKYAFFPFFCFLSFHSRSFFSFLSSPSFSPIRICDERRGFVCTWRER